MKIWDLEQPRIGDIVEFETDPETVVEGLIVGETEDGYIYEFSESGYTELAEACTHGKYYCSTDKKWKCRQGPKQSRVNENVNQGVAEGFSGIAVDIEPELDYDVVYVDINGKQYNFNYWHSNERPTNELGLRKDVPQYLKREEWYNRLDQPTKMEVLHAVVQAELGNEPSEYKPTVGDEPLDEVKQRLDPKCWDGYKKQGTKIKGGVRVNNCVPESAGYIARNSKEAKDPRFSASMTADVGTDTMSKQLADFFPTEAPKDGQQQVHEAEYQGREVPLGRPMRGDVKKFKVYVRDPKTGNVKKVNFGDPNMRIKKSNPARRKSFRARHNCKNPGPRTKARFWSCRKW